MDANAGWVKSEDLANDEALNVPIKVWALEKSIVPWAWATLANVSAKRVGPIARRVLATVFLRWGVRQLANSEVVWVTFGRLTWRFPRIIGISIDWVSVVICRDSNGREIRSLMLNAYVFNPTRVIRDVVKQRIERCKTEASRKPVPIGAEVAEILFAWRARCAYNQPEDWVFASSATKGKQPYWPSSIYRVYVKPLLRDELKITGPVGWHTLRHSLGTLIKATGEDVKTIQLSSAPLRSMQSC